jgi:hypothetical protein
MANKFRAIKNTSEPEKKSFQANKSKKQQASGNRNLKRIRKTFVTIFGLAILKKVNLRKNLAYCMLIIGMIVLLIYNSLNMQSKKAKIEKLEDTITTVNDALMDLIEEEYIIDDQQENELLHIAIEEGFQNTGTIPYTIKIGKQDKTE